MQTLQYAAFQVTPNDYCQSKYPYQAGPQVFCAVPYNRQRNEYPGYGDIGAPAVLRLPNNRNVLIGFYAFGAPEKIAAGEPSAFINICPSIEWIWSVVQPIDL